jgi:hypothetical protein
VCPVFPFFWNFWCPVCVGVGCHLFSLLFFYSAAPVYLADRAKTFFFFGYLSASLPWEFTRKVTPNDLPKILRIKVSSTFEHLQWRIELWKWLTYMLHWNYGLP